MTAPMLVSVTQGPEISPFFLVSVFIIILYTTKCFESITGLNISSLFRVNELFVFQIHLNGSELWMNNVLCVCVCVLAGCSVVQALEAATLHPARALGIDDRKGTLNFGSDADLVFLDGKLNVLSTWIASNCVHRNPGTKEHTIRIIDKSHRD